MMKRSKGVHRFIGLVLAAVVGILVSLTISMSSVLASAFFGFMAILTFIAYALNLICGPDKESNSNEDEK